MMLNRVNKQRRVVVSMKSGLGDRNNWPIERPASIGTSNCLNEVRSWRPEQSRVPVDTLSDFVLVSMKSGLGDRNNHPVAGMLAERQKIQSQ